VDKEGTFKSVFLRDAASATEKLNTHENETESLGFKSQPRNRFSALDFQLLIFAIEYQRRILV
jgi:hypothetical protein